MAEKEFDPVPNFDPRPSTPLVERPIIKEEEEDFTPPMLVDRGLGSSPSHNVPSEFEEDRIGLGLHTATPEDDTALAKELSYTPDVVDFTSSTQYWKDVVDNPLDGIKDNKDFRTDLDTFIRGRYNMSDDTLSGMSYDEKFDKFTTHMRWQETNEATALKDRWYVKTKEATTDEERAAFGRLMQAWDNSSEVVEDFGSFGKLGDYIKATLASPSTYVGVGVGKAVGKLTSRLANRSTAAGVRASTSNAVANAAVKATTRRMTPELLKGAGFGAFTEGTVALGHESLLHDTRSTAIENYKFDPDRFWGGVIAQSVLGGFTGGAARGYTIAQQNKALMQMEEFSNLNLKKAASARQRATEVLSGVPEGERDIILDNLSTIIDMGNSRIKKNPLDEAQIWGGNLMWDTLVTGDNKDFKGGFSVDLLKRIGAAGADLYRTINIDPEKRITENFSDALASNKITNETIDELLDKYNLTREQFSYLFMADLSNAGKTLAVASGIARNNTARIKDIQSAAERLLQSDLVTVDDEILKKAERLAMKANEHETGFGNFLRELDGMRIGFMTSQPSTTAANVVSSTGRVVVDASDRFFTNLKRGRNPFSGVLDVIKGMTFDQQQAELMAEMMSERTPLTAARIFNSARGLDDALTNGTGFMSRITRAVNVLNSASDAMFKKGVFYASINRQLKDIGNPALGKNWSEFVTKNKDISLLPPDILNKAKNDALKFTFQGSYTLDDSLFGKGAQTVIDTHKNIPFLVSSVVPFPRYVANQIEFIHDYSPLASITKGFDMVLDTKLFPDKTSDEFWSRQVTGTFMLLGSAYALRAREGGKTGPLEYTGQDGTNKSVERWGGPWNTHLVVADALYRYKNGLPPPKPTELTLEALETATGVGFTGYNSTLLGEIINSMQAGEWTTSGNKYLADIVATMTYPAAIVRDIFGEAYPDESAPAPYLKDLEQENVSLFDMIEFDSEFVNRSLRFLPDSPQLQYLQTFNGENDVPIYTGFNPDPARNWNPLIKQITGQNTTAPLTQLQKDLRFHRLKEWELYSSSRFPNPSVDFLTRQILSKGLPEAGIKPMWQAWEDETEVRERLATLDPEEAQSRLEKWTRDYISEVGGKVKDSFETARVRNPTTVAGYIRSIYNMEQSFYYDLAVKNEDSIPFQTAEEYIEDSNSIAEELSRREFVMHLADRFSKTKR